MALAWGAHEFECKWVSTIFLRDTRVNYGRVICQTSKPGGTSRDGRDKQSLDNKLLRARTRQGTWRQNKEMITTLVFNQTRDLSVEKQEDSEPGVSRYLITNPAYAHMAGSFCMSFVLLEIWLLVVHSFPLISGFVCSRV